MGLRAIFYLKYTSFVFKTAKSHPILRLHSALHTLTLNLSLILAHCILCLLCTVCDLDGISIEEIHTLDWTAHSLTEQLTRWLSLCAHCLRKYTYVLTWIYRTIHIDNKSFISMEDQKQLSRYCSCWLVYLSSTWRRVFCLERERISSLWSPRRKRITFYVYRM